MDKNLIKKWRITFQNGFILECYRERQPTNLARSWYPYNGLYCIEYLGTFNKGILNIRPRTEQASQKESR